MSDATQTLRRVDVIYDVPVKQNRVHQILDLRARQRRYSAQIETSFIQLLISMSRNGGMFLGKRSPITRWVGTSNESHRLCLMSWMQELGKVNDDKLHLVLQNWQSKPTFSCPALQMKQCDGIVAITITIKDGRGLFETRLNFLYQRLQAKLREKNTIEERWLHRENWTKMNMTKSPTTEMPTQTTTIGRTRTSRRRWYHKQQFWPLVEVYILQSYYYL